MLVKSFHLLFLPSPLGDRQIKLIGCHKVKLQDRRKMQAGISSKKGESAFLIDSATNSIIKAALQGIIQTDSESILERL